MKSGRLPRLAAALVLVAVGVGFPTAAIAAPTEIAPECGEYVEIANFAPGLMVVIDPADLDPADLPGPATIADMSCAVDFRSGTETVRAYSYLLDPFAAFVAKARAFVADGFVLFEVPDADTRLPVDIDALVENPPAGFTNLVFQRGGIDYGALHYNLDTDNANSYPVPGTYIAVNPEITDFGGGVATVGGTGIDDPSTISDLRTIGDAVPTPAQGGLLIISAALLTLLLAIPAFLLSRVLSARYAQWFGWLERGRVGRWRDELTKPKNALRRWLFLAAGAVLAAFISGFIDPDFGFNGLSVRLFFTLLATFAIFNIGAWAVVTLVLRRVQPDAKPVLTFHPASLLVVAVAVLLSRLLDFDPGVVFGLVAGTTFAVTLALSKEAIVILAGSAYAGVVALVAWILYSILSALNPLDAFAVGLTELLGGLTIEGVSTLPIALVPLATLDGGILFRWRRWVWAVAYAVGLALFMLVLFNLPGGDIPADGDFVRWVIVFVVFAVVATAVWLVDYLLRRRTPSAPTPAQ